MTDATSQVPGDHTRFVLERTSGGRISDQELILDLQRVARYLQSETVGMLDYRKLGRYNDTTIARRFGTWNKALDRARLRIRHSNDTSDEALFENILSLWTHYGRQPRRADLSRPPSKYSQSPYNRRFRSWKMALQAFVEYANESSSIERVVERDPGQEKKPASRDPNLRLRYRVLSRDKFKCVACGASPAIDSAVQLHVDHITPWSQGGETVLANLRTLCANCNLGKGALVSDYSPA